MSEGGKGKSEPTSSFYPNLRSGWMETEKTQKGANLGQIPKFVRVLFQRPLEWMDGNKHTLGPTEILSK